MGPPLGYMVEAWKTLHSLYVLLPPCRETLRMASIPHIVALEVELPHGW